MILGITTARVESRRLRNKNMRMFCGYPLVYWTITQLMCSHLIDEVWITTDWPELAEYVKGLGANVFLRERQHWDMTAGIPQSQMLRCLIEDGKSSRYGGCGKSGMYQYVTYLMGSNVSLRLS